MMRYILLAVGIIAALSGCGTLIPGPRYTVNVDDFCFTGDGSTVVYRENLLRYYPFLLHFREGHALYLYDRAIRKHRLLARTEAFSVSPFDTRILVSPPWEARYRAMGKAPDFYLLDYRTKQRRGFRMPPDFRGDYLTYGFAFVQWEKGGEVTAFVNFAYCPGMRPTSWKKQGAEPLPCRVQPWKVTIDPAFPGDTVTEAVPWEGKALPEIPWGEIRKKKVVSPDGREKLVFSKYGGHYTFNTTLTVDGSGREYVVREHRLINIIQMGKSILYYLAAAPVLGLNNLLSR